MMLIFKALSALLSYPGADLVASLDEIRVVVDEETCLPKGERDALLRLIDDLAAHDLVELQERYVLLFDRTRSLSLHMFEHVHGESRDRGQAMVDLRALYESKGVIDDSRELPDFVPLFLEFLSIIDPSEAFGLIAEPAHVFAALAERLNKRGSVYEAIFRALGALARVRPDAKLLAALRAEPDPEPDDLEALDEAYEDAPVTFGGPGEACDPDALTARLRQARRPAPGIVQSSRPQTEFTHSDTKSS
ncbi:nitrate reductase molybdenum cofactor assembly chaperone [Pinisolibacter aquiterrae]|jgi:nitrate reductase delta subunit|uniref:nitrate reductase molybdenum cofactor assembly chaperone n=1 Tax=Pinisolibacter aquiterrae TaxID=2815579 RepID=UPI00308420A2